MKYTSSTKAAMVVASFCGTILVGGSAQAGEIRGLRAANGGSLTPGERALVNRQQDALSRRIYRERHDGDVRW